MKIVKTVLFVLLTTLFCSSQIHAQNSLFDINDLSNIKIDNYTDDDLVSFYNKAIESGISESQFYKMAANRGLPDSEIIKLRNRLTLINSARKPTYSSESGNKNSGADTISVDNTGQKIALQQFQNDESIFGSELFTTNSLVFEPNLRIPAPAGYILGPDDEIIINVYGFSEMRYDLKVNELGEIYIPNVGPILVSGLSIEQAGEKIKNRLASTIYKAIASGKTQVQISLGKIKSIRVTVIGQAKKPGTYTVSSLTTLYNLLYLCGGPTPMGSYRDIEIIRGNELKEAADLYNFLIGGNQKDNILLQEGDVIRIPYYKNRVVISGNVKREGKFEMFDTETFNDLLKYCGGFTDNAYRGAVTVIRLTDTEKKILDVASSEYSTFLTNGSDEYIVRKLQDEYGNRIVISGSVLRPGPYQLTPDITIKDLIEEAGGLTPDAYTKGVSIFRYLNNKMPTTLSVDLDSVLQSERKIYLKKNDSVYIHSIFDFHDKNYITIEGNVRKPGEIPWRENFTLHDLLLAVGGLNESGDSSNIEISRRIRNANVGEANHEESEVFNIDLAGQNSADVYLQPFDVVIVKTLPGYTHQRTVLVLGEVKSPGRYSLEKSGDRISDIIKRVGGFKASADSTSITIRRITKSNLTIQEKERLFQRVLDINPDSVSQDARLKDELYKTTDLISVDLNAALAHPESSDNLSLENGDILTIDRNSNLVKISGEVYYPTIVTYRSNKRLKYYIEQAGNFTSYARKNGSLVIHPDGRTESVKHFLWFKIYPSVSPRSEIYVPQKNKSNRTKISIGELALLVSSLGIIVNVLKL